MSPSKRFEETTIRETDVLARTYTCEVCKHTFQYFDVDTLEETKPNFCPKCGRRNSDA